MEQTQLDLNMMRLALEEAKLALEEGEVPVGALLVKNGNVLATGRNCRESKKTALGHAELMAIQGGCEALGGWRLEETTLYVTLEPCPMCAGAICNARISRVVYAAPDPKNGAFGSKMQMNDQFYNHQVKVDFGLCQEEAAALLEEFFQRLRNRTTRWNKQTHSYEEKK